MINVLQYSECSEEKAKIDTHLSDLIGQGGFPGDAFEDLELNDSFRLEQKIGLVLFLKATGQSYEKYVQRK